MSADEIDAELLAMAGDSSEDEGDDIDQTQVVEDKLSNDEDQEPAPRVVEAPARTKGVAQKVKARGRRKRRQQEGDIDDDDINDDSADRSPSPAYSPDARAADESEGEIDGDDGIDDEAPLFPLEGKFENVRDREAIMAMNEIEREELLAERAAQVLRRQQDLQLKKALADSRASANRNKRKAIDTDTDDGSKRNIRPKTDKRSALDDYRKAREQKGAERNRLDLHRNDRNARSPSPRSDRDAGGESEVEWAEPAADKHRNEPPAELKDFERCRVGRSNFARVCFYPAFEETIRGCFCRVNIGISKESGQAEYRMTQIKGFTEGKPYTMETSNGKRFTTDQFAIVAQGSNERPYPFSACSDSPFTDAEFARFSETLRKDNIRLPLRRFLLNKLERIHALLHTNFTEETLQLKFNKQRAMQLKHDPVHMARVKREAIEKRRVEARESGDTEELEKCDAELTALMNGTAISHVIKPSASPVTNSQNLDRLAKLNHKNRGKTTQEVRQALIEERRKLQREREEAAARKAKAAEDAIALEQRIASTTRESSVIQRSSTPSNGGPLGALKRKNLDDDVIGSLDLGIDLEI